jgi:hypothetical protein
MPHPIVPLISMVTLRGLVDSILRKNGWEPIVRDGIVEAQQGGRRLNVGFLEEGHVYDSVAGVLSKREGVRILVSLVELSPDEAARAERAGISVWGRSAIEEEIGAAIVTHLQMERGGLFEALAVRSAAAVPADRALPLLVDEGDGPEKVLKPILLLNEVKEISSKTTGGYKFELELVPFYFYDYFCIVKISGIESPDKRAGTIGVNALTGEAQPWGKLPEVVSDIGEPHIRLEPKVGQEDSDAIAKAKVVSLHTEEVERVTEKGHARIYDKVVVRPEPGDVTVEPMGLLYVPMWCVEGLHGAMVINAVTAKVVSEDYYNKPDSESGKSA